MRNPTSLTHTFRLPAERRAVFDLFADPRLLDRLTPPWFRLQPAGEIPRTLEAGMVVSYRLRWRSFPCRWTSLLTDWQAPAFIAYEQQQGPFRFFRHEHVFESRGGETEVRDRVTFRAPGGVIVDRLIVGPDLRRIFAFREQQAVTVLRDRYSTGSGFDGASRIPRTSASSSAIERPM